LLEFITSNWQWILPGIIVLAVLAALLTKPVRVWLRSTAFILDLAASYKRNAKIIPRSIFVSEITYGCGSQDVVADLYRPNGRGGHSGLILTHGAIKNGKNDQALRFAGQSLARAGYVVLVPQLDNLCKLRLHQDDIDALVATFQYLITQEFSNGKIGMLGVCISTPLVLLAATEPSVSRDLAIVSSWGGFYDINDWLQAVLMRHYINNGELIPWQPRPLLIEETPKWLIELLPNDSDRAYLEKMLVDGFTESAKDNLSTSGRALYELLTNREPERVADLWAKLDPKIHQTLNSMSPHTKMDKLKTKIAIIHTLSDDVIPWVESYKLADAIDDSCKVYFRVFEQFYHVSIEDLLKARISNLHKIISEAIHLYLYMYSILYRL
jgi:dienelactone hydrolase